MLPSEETVGGINLSSTVTLTKKEAIMRKVKLIVHETYQGKRIRQGTVPCLDKVHREILQFHILMMLTVSDLAKP